jgi:hypothetical protein
VDQIQGVRPAPFGVLGRLVGNRIAFEVARLFVVAVGIANIVLLGRLVRRRHWFGVLIALLSLAFYLDTIISTHTILLEPLLVFGTLVGFLLVFDDAESATLSSSRWLLAGVALGLTASTKIWEFLPLVVLLGFAAWRDRRCLSHYVMGAVGAIILVCAPFFFLAPGTFFHDVIIVQVTRSHLHQVSEKSRLWNLLGLPRYGHIPLRATIWIPIAVCIIAVLIYLLIVFVRRGYSRGSLTSLDAGALACLVLVGLAYFASAEYDPHYGGFFAPFLALVLSTIALRLFPTTKPAVFVIIATAVLAYFAASDRSFIETKSSNVPVPTAAIHRAFSASACVISQTYAPLILSTQYNLFEKDCPRALDIYGTELTDGNGTANLQTDVNAPKLQAAWLNWLRHAHGVILLLPVSRNANLGTAARNYFAKNYSLASHLDGLYIYKRH